jgi:hypothetical protein
MESAEFGKPDGFQRQRADTAQEYIDKKPLDGNDPLGAQGRATPNASKDAETVDYFDKSEAEFGR